MATDEHRRLAVARDIKKDVHGRLFLLTPLGESLRPILNALIEWGTHHATELDEVHRLLPCEAVVRDRRN
ncbi:hypothetical protein [Pseudomonas sp. C1C7]|uniref:hypothetical protein n=1 Tax=Pseudomonas sp. C1C7 TaxID=2735272 RepID=UPI001C49C253|nr:hypothetical protein [Pseudomonas sp. C1C7]